ncbi:MAG: cytochrome C oxidase subunit IV family protein [Candidatus Binataceae bacterium]
MNEFIGQSASPHDDRKLYVTVWAMLVLLLVVGLTIFVLPIPRDAAIALIFGVAGIKAALVLRNYMHLKHEHLLIYAIILVPALFMLGLAIALVPDIVFRHAM